MKNQVQLVLLLFFAFTFLVYVFPFIYIDAAKLESGVTINEAAPSETEKICDDRIDNDNDGKIDGDDSDCAAAPKRPPAEIAEICGNGNDQHCVPPAGPAGETCGLQILEGVPINYEVDPNGLPKVISGNEAVVIKNVGTINAKILVKGGNWVSDAAGNPTVSGPNITRVALAYLLPGLIADTPPYTYGNKMGLQSNGINVGGISPGIERALWFQIKLAPLMLDGGSFHQEISIDLLCGDNEFLKEDETKGDYNTSAKTPNTPSPVPIPYPDTNNTTTGMQIRAD